MSTEKKVVLISSDGQKFEVEKSTAVESETIKLMINDDLAENVIPVPKVNSTTLALVIQFCKKHAEAKVAEESTEAFDTDFIKVDNGTLFDLIMAGNYLNIISLLDLTCQAVADMIKGKTREEICVLFNIQDKVNSEEEEEIRRENAWAFE